MTTTAAKGDPKPQPPIYDQSPAAIRERDQWMLSRLETKTNKTTGEVKETKVPCAVARAGRVPFDKADATNPANWTSYRKALAAMAAHPGIYQSPGYCFSPDDPFTGIDLDGCLSRKNDITSVKDWARPVLELFKGTYREISQSGLGIKIWCEGVLPPDERKSFEFEDNGKRCAIEIYSQARYFAVTGNRCPGAPAKIRPRQQAIEQTLKIAAKLMAEHPLPSQKAKVAVKSADGKKPKAGAAMSAELIALALGGATKSGGGWMCRCPCHDDQKPSLSVKDHGGTVLVHCFAGCDSETEVIPALKRQGLWPAPRRRRREIESTHEYTNADGQVSFEVVRFEKDPGDPDASKALTRHWGGQAKCWVWNAEGCTRYLYNLPKVVKAKTVYLCEGEKDADALIRLGLCATTNAWGANAKWLPRYTESLLHKTVYLLPDNDEPGRVHMATTAYLLRKAGISCKIVELPGLDEKGDVRDWLKAGGTKEKLVALAKAAAWYKLRWQDLPAKAKTAEVIDDTGPSRLVTRWLADVEAEPVNWLWANRLPRGMITMIAGDPGLAKSTIAAHWAAVLTAPSSAPWRQRRDYWPDAVRRQGGPFNVVVISAEDGAGHTIRPRHEAAGADLSHVCEVEHVRIAAQGEEGRMFSLESDVRELEKKIEEVGNVAMVVVDPVTAYMGRIDTHKNSEVRAVLAPLAKLAEKYNVAVVIITHLTKEETKSWKSILGTVGFYALARVAYLVIEDPADEPDEGERRKLMFHIKGTLHLGEKPPALAYNTTEVEYRAPKGLITTTRIDWEDEPVELKLEEAMAMRKEAGEPSPRQQQVIGLLESEPGLRAVEIFENLDWQDYPNPHVFMARMAARKFVLKKGMQYWPKN
jgi:hypothetical protein